METRSVDLTSEMRSVMLRWVRFTTRAMEDTMKIGQPMLDAWFGSMEKIPSRLEQYSRRSCEIPQTECPPYCVCDMRWDACERGTVNGTIAVSNTGDDASSFSLGADSLKTADHDSGVVPKLEPATFTLKPGESKNVAVSAVLGADFDGNEIYRSEVKIAGRYEQCVRLHIRVQPQQHPHCRVDHGEIPKRIVSHDWYDHFQCEELCFKPVSRSPAPVRPTPAPNEPARPGRPGTKKKSRS